MEISDDGPSIRSGGNLAAILLLFNNDIKKKEKNKPRIVAVATPPLPTVNVAGSGKLRKAIWRTLFEFVANFK